MITEKDLIEAIAECQGKRNPDASTCIKLAAFYTIKNELYPKREAEPERFTGYSFENRETAENIHYTGESEFAQLLDGFSMERACGIFDELMSSLQIVEPRLYQAVLRKFRD